MIQTRPATHILYVPLTTQDRQSRYEVRLPKLGFLDRDSVVNVQGLGSLPRARLERKLGILPDDVMAKIKRAPLQGKGDGQQAAQT